MQDLQISVYPNGNKRKASVAKEFGCLFILCRGVSMNALAKMFSAHTSSVLKWIRKFAKEHYEKPEPVGNAIIMELDEMWHDVKK
ncbi:MAG: hypothetical protein ACE5F7_11715, partial [Nitrospiria bacterium]